MAITFSRGSDEDVEKIEFLKECFLENYSFFKGKKEENTEKKSSEDEDMVYELLSSPSPSQYRAFAEFFGFFKDKEKILESEKIVLYTYDLLHPEGLVDNPRLEFLENLVSSGYGANGEDIALTSGFFWKGSSITRRKIISDLKKLYEKGAKIRIRSQAESDEDDIADIIEPIKNRSNFGLEKRIPIHFIKAGTDYVILEFPHTESFLFRLAMFLDLQKLDSELAERVTKKDLLDFFDKYTETRGGS